MQVYKLRKEQANKLKTQVNMAKKIIRCAWVPHGNVLMEKYHDLEWGVPRHDDRVHFEFLILEGAQAGLSWETILKRRAEYAQAFAHFDWEKVAHYQDNKIEDLLHHSGIIKNRLKIASAINNAKKFIEIREEFGSFDTYIWNFVGGKPICKGWKAIKDIPSETKESQQLSKDLKKRGFTFVGPTILYAHMQAVGLYNDHTIDCFKFNARA